MKTTNNMYSCLKSPGTSTGVNTEACPKGMTKISVSEPYLTGDYKDINVPVGSDFEQTYYCCS